MPNQFSAEEVAIMIRARQLLKARGLVPNADATAICNAAGISRKSGYQWAEKHAGLSGSRQKELEDQLAQLQLTHDQLKEQLEWVSFLNRGQKLAWELHDVDEMIAAKKNTSNRKKREKA